MIRTLHLMIKSLGYNLKTLVYFEILYRVLGVILVYPLISRLFYWSIDISPFVYITNKDLMTYLLSPPTLIIMLLMVIIMTIYFMIEILFLQLIFEFSVKEITLNLKFLLLSGLDQLRSFWTMKPIYLVFPAISFVYLTLFISIYGFASTIELPMLINQLRADELINRVVIGFTLFVLILFISTMLYLPIYGYERTPFKTVRHKQKDLMKRRYYKSLIEFISLNLIINLLVYSLYFLMLYLLGWLIQVTRGEGYVVPTLFTFIYAIYVFIGFLSTLFFIPINIAYITAIYHLKNESIVTPKTLDFYLIKPNSKHSTWSKRLGILTIIALIVLNISTVYQIFGADRTPIELLNRTAVIAHRGASIYAPENTLSALELAIEQGADAVEIDVRLSKDGIPFLFHDYTANRTTNIPFSLSIESLTFEEIQSFDAGSWFDLEFANEKIPSLEQAINLIKGRTHLYLEIKGTTPGIENIIMDLLIEHEMTNSTTIMSFSQIHLQRIRAMDDNITTMLLIPVFAGSISPLVDLDYIDGFGLRLDMIKAYPEYVDMIHNQNKKVYVWTLNREDDITYAVNEDVDGVITDDPLMAIELVYEKVTPSLLQDLIRRLFNKTRA